MFLNRLAISERQVRTALNDTNGIVEPERRSRKPLPCAAAHEVSVLEHIALFPKVICLLKKASLRVERRTRDREVTGSKFTCAILFFP